MKIEECYQQLGGNYNEAFRRFGNDERIKKYLKMICSDTNYETAGNAIATKDYKTAFRAAHTLKGLALNMGFTNLAETASILTEKLRGMEYTEGLEATLDKVTFSYQTMLNAINQLLSNND